MTEHLRPQPRPLYTGRKDIPPSMPKSAADQIIVDDTAHENQPDVPMGPQTPKPKNPKDKS